MHSLHISYRYRCLGPDTICIVLVLLAYTPKAKHVVLNWLDHLVFHKLTLFIYLVTLRNSHTAHYQLSKCCPLCSCHHALCLCIWGWGWGQHWVSEQVPVLLWWYQCRPVRACVGMVQTVHRLLSDGWWWGWQHCEHAEWLVSHEQTRCCYSCFCQYCGAKWAVWVWMQEHIVWALG